MNINERMDLILKNAENLYQWLNDQISDQVFYAEKSRIEALLYPA
jgi:hypothetical protein